MSERKFNIGDQAIKKASLKQRIIDGRIGNIMAAEIVTKIVEDAEGYRYILGEGQLLSEGSIIKPDEAVKYALNYVASLFQRISDAIEVKS